MVPEGPLFHKPKSFLSARQAIYASMFVGVVALVLRSLSLGVETTGGTAAIGAIAAFYLAIILLVKQMSLCRRWARGAVLLLYILAIIVYPLAMSRQMRASMMVIALLVIEAALVIYALLLLYNRDCSRWFSSSLTPEELP